MSPAPTKEPFAPSRDFLNYLACQPRNRANCRPHATNKFRFRETFSLLIPRWYRDNKTAFLLVHDYSRIFNGGNTILLRGNNSFKFVHYANYARALFLWNIIGIAIEERNSTELLAIGWRRCHLRVYFQHNRQILRSRYPHIFPKTFSNSLRSMSVVWNFFGEHPRAEVGKKVRVSLTRNRCHETVYLRGDGEANRSWKIRRRASSCLAAARESGWRHFHRLDIHGYPRGKGPAPSRDFRPTSFAESRNATLTTRQADWTDPPPSPNLLPRENS